MARHEGLNLSSDVAVLRQGRGAGEARRSAEKWVVGVGGRWVTTVPCHDGE